MSNAWQVDPSLKKSQCLFAHFTFETSDVSSHSVKF
jgi:hypothetical protein